MGIDMAWIRYCKEITIQEGKHRFNTFSEIYSNVFPAKKKKK